MAVDLADFDPQVVAEYDITEDDLRRVEHYLRLLRGSDAPALKDIAVGGYYGTSALLHEVVELDILLKREPRLLEMNRDDALVFWCFNEDAHARALAPDRIRCAGAGPRVAAGRIRGGRLKLACKPIV